MWKINIINIIWKNISEQNVKNAFKDSIVDDIQIDPNLSKDVNL